MTDRTTRLTTASVMSLAPVIPVLVIDRAEDAVPLAQALTEAEKMRLDILDKGVTQAELDRVLTELRSSFEQRAKSDATRPSRGIVNSIIEEIDENDVYTSAPRDLRDELKRSLRGSEIRQRQPRIN